MRFSFKWTAVEWFFGASLVLAIGAALLGAALIGLIVLFVGALTAFFIGRRLQSKPPSSGDTSPRDEPLGPLKRPWLESHQRGVSGILLVVFAVLAGSLAMFQWPGMVWAVIALLFIWDLLHAERVIRSMEYWAKEKGRIEFQKKEDPQKQSESVGKYPEQKPEMVRLIVSWVVVALLFVWTFVQAYQHTSLPVWVWAVIIGIELVVTLFYYMTYSYTRTRHVGIRVVADERQPGYFPEGLRRKRWYEQVVGYSIAKKNLMLSVPANMSNGTGTVNAVTQVALDPNVFNRRGIVLFTSYASRAEVEEAVTAYAGRVVSEANSLATVQDIRRFKGGYDSLTDCLARLRLPPHLDKSWLEKNKDRIRWPKDQKGVPYTPDTLPLDRTVEFYALNEALIRDYIKKEGEEQVSEFEEQGVEVDFGTTTFVFDERTQQALNLKARTEELTGAADALGPERLGDQTPLVGALVASGQVPMNVNRIEIPGLKEAAEALGRGLRGNF